MKYFTCTLLIFICICSCTTSTAQGRFAGSMKQYIGKSYSDEKHVPWLKSYNYGGGSIISPVDDATQFCSFLYQKGNSVVVFFTQGESGKPFAVIDVLEIKNIQPSWKVRIIDCDNGNEGANNIVAMVRAQKGKKDIVLKAWRCNMDKIRFEAMGTKLVHCSGDEQF